MSKKPVKLMIGAKVTTKEGVHKVFVGEPNREGEGSNLPVEGHWEVVNSFAKFDIGQYVRRQKGKLVHDTARSR